MTFLTDLSKGLLVFLSSLGVWHTILVNAVGIISIGLLFISYQAKDRYRILMLYIFAAAGWALYFVLQGDLVSALMNVVGIIRSIIFMQRGKHKWAESILWLFGFIAIMTVFTDFHLSEYRPRGYSESLSCPRFQTQRERA